MTVDTGACPLRLVTLPAGRRLFVRPVTTDDVEGLMALYADLDDEDRYHRFFSLYHPQRAFFETMATVAERGGFGLVAIVTDDADTPARIIGEAGYTLLDDGNGELAITIAREWRGWLGAYLLDALVDVAAERGVPNLRADVLVTNRPMLALVRARGYVTVGHPDWSIVRVLIGTAGRTPRWYGDARQPRVLVEVPGGRWAAEEEARAAGMHVLVCPGPGSYPAHCPALAGEPCPLAAEADVIVVAPLPGDERWHALLEAHADLHPGVPVAVARRGGDARIVRLVQRLAAEKIRREAATRSDT